MLDISTKLTINKDLVDSKNLCDRFTSDELDAIGKVCLDGYKRDRQSRSKWERRNAAAMDLAMQVQVAKTFPWPGCSNVVFPLVTIAALQFSARSYSNLVQGTNVVRYRVIGKEDQLVRERAKRIGKHMSWQVLEQDEAWEEEKDRLLINLAIVGTNYNKSFYDPGLGYPVDEFVMASDLVMDYWAKSVERAARVTQHVPLYKNEVYERCVRGTFRNVRDEGWFNRPPPSSYDTLTIQQDKREGVQDTQPDDEGAFRFHEQHRWFDFDKDGYSEPYICTYEASTGHVVRIISRFDMEAIERKNDIASGRIMRINPEQFFTKYSLIPNPEGGNLDLGFGVFLGPLNESVNSSINQLIDWGTLNNSMGGLFGRGAKMRSGVFTMAPWEWRRVDSSGDDLRKSIYMFPERKPADVLFSLLGLLVEYANRIAGTVDATVGENPGQNTPASTYQGMTEQGMQIYSMVFKRFWRSMKNEFKKRYELNGRYLDTRETFGPGDDFIRREDYLGNPDQVAPVANPRVTSRMMRLQQAIILKDEAKVEPGYDRKEVTLNFLDALEVEGSDRLYPGPEVTGPLPNWRVQVEQLKLEGKKMEFKADQLKWANELMENKRLNNAKIDALEAQAHKLMKEAGAVGVTAEIEALRALIEAHKSYGDMVNERIGLLTQAGSNETGSGSDSGGEGVQRLAGPSSDSGVSQGATNGSGGR
jgi:chaperonin GroES